MTKKEVIEAFEGLDDDAQILVKTSDNDDYCYNIYMAGDKVSQEQAHWVLRHSTVVHGKKTRRKTLCGLCIRQGGLKCFLLKELSQTIKYSAETVL